MQRKKNHGRVARLRSTDLPNDLTTQFVSKINALRSSVKTDYLKAEIMDKHVSSLTDPADVRRQRAINKWLATERENEATNDRLLLTPEDFQILPWVSIGEFTEWCRDLIREIIGDYPPVDALIGAFSGGASTSRKRTSSHPATKYLGQADVTPEAWNIFSSIADEMPGWLGARDNLSIRFVPGNVMFTVPKKTDIDRVACKEPDLNMFIQKGLGDYISGCLRRIGINLNDQTRNRSLAHEGSVTNRLATLDLSSASDSVSEGLVALLLPEIWFTHLDAVRCRVTIIDGEEHRNHMFSSMGNGFTFELESLLFYVLTRATCYFRGARGVVSVYGDDIICPAGVSDDVMRVLNYFGFSINLEKSYVDGPFRESCGGHYWNGLDITPFYVRKPITSVVDVIHQANNLREWGTIAGVGCIDPEVEAIWLWLKSYVPDILWGGGDTSFKYQLVSYDTPQFRLHQEKRKKKTGAGGYYHWLNATWDRTVVYDGVRTSSHTVETEDEINNLVLKRVRNSTVPQLPAQFLSEIESTPRVLAP